MTEVHAEATIRHAPKCPSTSRIDATRTTVGAKRVTVFRCDSCGAVALNVEDDPKAAPTKEKP